MSTVDQSDLSFGIMLPEDETTSSVCIAGAPPTGKTGIKQSRSNFKENTGEGRKTRITDNDLLHNV